MKHPDYFEGLLDEARDAAYDAAASVYEDTHTTPIYVFDTAADTAMKHILDFLHSCPIDEEAYPIQQMRKILHGEDS